ncbi:ABC-type zinc uptake system zinc chaperone [Shewanella sp. D64]|uniref:ABC-type zinc uptake system zinc chaperone n=1 Tax=unclassified Shewanella TaxID=196818 RepID=UPI0022BA2EE5|nr:MULTISPECIES: ABC-type zinc uptake system zinc chaperone [unclassified Shewanella]MEC4725522.1 ABC-type zinc uptake system zinc chaperone [Shewanella sp. D64]MEC4738659.1 ABC-type zinc uptake system zinc chaperone [Shewanella sp. E94]WBJ94957.1 ABC-type zinc uptake system zinc chaperone [Shewanella sp. MTB7]
MVKNSVRRGIAIWLSALLICLSFAASAHSVEHINDGGAQTHCTLCFHKHQLNKLLPTHHFDLTVNLQTYEVSLVVIDEQTSQHTSFFRSRAPPVAA